MGATEVNDGEPERDVVADDADGPETGMGSVQSRPRLVRRWCTIGVTAACETTLGARDWEAVPRFGADAGAKRVRSMRRV